MKDKSESLSTRYDEITQAQLSKDIKEAGFFIRTIQQAALDNVEKGNVDGISRVIKAYVFIGANSEVAIPLRSRKNRFIALCGLACDRAVTAGLDENAVNDIWESYSDLCNDCRAVENVNTLTIKLLLDLTGRVKATAEKQLSASAEKVKEYVANHLSERISVAEIAADLGMNASYLNSSFKQQAGKCITDYVQTQKIQQAKLLLASGEGSIADIWTGLGYYDQSHFSRMFKRHTGYTPKQFRTIHLKTGKGP